MTTCCECGSTTSPLWYSNDEWAAVPVCLECVKKRHWNGIKFLSLVNIMSGILFLLVHGLELVISVGIVTWMLVMELVILLAFSPYPLYGENRRRYKEWKERTKRNEEEKK